MIDTMEGDCYNERKIMFSHLTDFAYKRIFTQAIGFYIAYLFVLILVEAIAIGIAEILVPSMKTYPRGFSVGNAVAPLYIAVIGFLLINKKSIVNFGYILLVLVASLVSVFWGGLGGMIFLAFISSRRPNAS